MDRLFTSAKQFCKSDSPKTTKSYRLAMVQFGQAKYGETVPEDELLLRLDQYIQTASRQNVLDDLRAFKDWLDDRKIVKERRDAQINTKYAPRTKMLRISILQSWFVKNEMGLPKAYMGEFGYKEKPETDDLPFTYESALAVYHQLKSALARCMFVVLLVTGCRIDEITHIRLQDITWDYKLPDGTRGPVRIRLDGAFTKNGKSRIIFLTRECEDLLKELWTEKEHPRVSRRGTDRRRKEEWNTGRQLYLISTAGKRLGNFPNVKTVVERKSVMDDDRLFPISAQTIEEVLSKAIMRAGYVEKTKTDMNKLHVHSTRKFFRTQFGLAAGPDAAETIAGHSAGLTLIYRHIEEGQLAVLYQRHQGSLRLFRDKETEVVRDRVNQQADRLLAIEREAAKQQAERDTQMAEMQTQLKKMQEKLALMKVTDTNE